MTAPVPAPISSTDELAGSTSDAMRCESFGELGARAPIALGFSSRERTKSSGVADVKLIVSTWRIPEWLKGLPALYPLQRQVTRTQAVKF